ncbi:flagellar basal-body rod modification protein FlgD [Legionella wadsworthii]|uniref:Basal-body rod modification protein FlgD n=2 Tax=Legionella wadsworthii TaxID=28088 RepID=A0A378LS79_9GAMM|nr:flagellar basal-body rod modification protein FlgD [Legionella wadsworthii]
MNDSNADSNLNNFLDPQEKNNLGQQDFLRLMVAQIQSQDALQQQVNDEFRSQFTQFNTKDGTDKMQESLHKMATSLQSNKALQASALVGRKVLVPSSILQLGTEGSSKMAVDVGPNLSDLNAFIYSESGDILKIIPLGQPAMGLCHFSWDGTGNNHSRMPEGKYPIEVYGRSGGKRIFLKTMVYGNIDSVSLSQNGEGLKLNVCGIGQVSLDQVRQISV